MHTHLHNVKEKEMEFGHVSVIGEKEKNKHMLVVSDTSFCSNNSKNVCFIFKTKFCWHSLYAAVEILSLFLKEKKIYMTELLCCSRTESHGVCALCLFSRKMLFVSFSAHWLLAYFCPLMDADPFRYQDFKGLHELSFPWWRKWQPRTIQTENRLPLNIMDFHRVLDTESSDNLLKISTGLMCKMCEQLTCDHVY